MIQHHGNALLFLGGVRDVRRWKAVQAEVVQPSQLPDGLLEVYCKGQTKPDYYLVEIATYPERRVRDQMERDIHLVLLQRKVLPEALTVVLRPRGQGVETSRERQSRLGWSQTLTSWRVVELWNVPAADLLAANDVGLILWLPLTQFDGPPENLLRQCRERIDQQALRDERGNLLAVTQVMAELRFHNIDLVNLIGGQPMFLESPLVKEVLAKQTQENLLEFLTARFGEVPKEVETKIKKIKQLARLKRFIVQAAVCPDLEAFRTHLFSRANGS
jgi:hypothetical protein